MEKLTGQQWSSIKLSTGCFSWMTEKIVEMADRYSGKRLISVFEGGYCLERLPELISNHVAILLAYIPQLPLIN
ncbi:MAG: hypothetical protein WCA08_06290 [Desulfoferrobacter sp.]